MFLSPMFSVVGVRADGSRKVLAAGLNQGQAENIAATLGTTGFSQLVIEAMDESPVVMRPPCADEGSLPWLE